RWSSPSGRRRRRRRTTTCRYPKESDMGEYEPKDSRNVTQSRHRAPGEPPRTGPREGETRQPQGELDDDGRGERAGEAIAQADSATGAGQRVQETERGVESRGREGPERFNRND